MFIKNSVATVGFRSNQLSLSAVRVFSSGLPSCQQVMETLAETKNLPKLGEERLQAKEFDEIPGPTRLGLFADFLPGGALNKANLVQINEHFRKRFGDIYCLKGMLGKPNIVFTYNPKDIEVTYRNEGVWPVRVGLESFTYYRKEKRPDVFKGVGGLVSEQGKSWAEIRNKVNPILMKVQNVRQNLTQIDQIASEFLAKMESHRDPVTGLLNSDFVEELKMWSFESISYIALNTRMGLMTNKPNVNAHKLAKNMADFFNYSFDYDVVPSFWKYFETPGFKRLIHTYDSITEITTNFIDAAIEKFETEGNVEAKSVLEKLCRLDRQVAVVMAMDMLMAGIDTTTSAFTTVLYFLATHPEKQEALRREMETLMPEPDTPLTEENTKNMPYMRACIKEALRITPITPGNFRMAGKDLVLSGYKVPEGTGVMMGTMALANTDTYFPRSAEFLPERWLKSDAPSACPAARTTNPFVYLPFGFGPRTCIGKRIAEMEIETLMSKLIRNYRVTWNAKDTLKYTSNIILVPGGNVSFHFEKLHT